MKKIITVLALALTVVMLLSLSACGSESTKTLDVTFDELAKKNVILSDNSIRLMKLERREPTLESLFMEMTGE